MLTSFFHTGFVVRDLEAAIGFYTDVLGLSLTGRTERTGEFPSTLLGFPETHIRGAFLDVGEGHQLELIQYLNPVGGVAEFDKNNIRAAHLAFFVEDIDRFYEDTRERGVAYGTAPVAMYDDAGNMLRKALYCQDPDGNWLELVELY
jgi:catechol 2,3-dioxygenase-like lactoylglutathione lyase family enzyme